MNSAPLLERSIPSAVWAVSWPMVLLGFLRSSVFLVDAYWIGGLGPEALSALGGCAFAWWILAIFSDLGGTGMLTLVARAEGAGLRGEIPRHLAQAAWVGLGTTTVVVAVWPLRGLYLDAVGFVPGTAEHHLGLDFLGASMLGIGATAAQYVVAAVFRALGQTRTALALTTASLLVNAALDPLLIHGVSLAPALGIAGAAWATAAANLVGACLGVWLLRREGITPHWSRPLPEQLLRITRIGAPVTAAGIGFSLVYVVLGGMITHFGVHEMGALGLGHRLESIPYLFGVGMSVGASTLVGQFLGAGRPEDARRAATIAALQCTAAMLLMSALLGFFGTDLMALFTDDPRIIHSGGIYLSIQSLVFVFMGLEIVYEGAFTGSGHTQPALWIGLLGTAGRIPLAWFLAFGLELGITGVWSAIAISTLLKGMAMPLWFTRGTWTSAV